MMMLNVNLFIKINEPSEESFKSSVIYLITLFPFSIYLHLFKLLADNSFHSFSIPDQQI